MTFVGKVLVVLQVVLSVCFMAFAAAVFSVHESWRGKHEALTTRYETERQAASDREAELQNQFTAADAQRKEAEDRVAGLDAENRALKDDLANRDESLKQAIAERDGARVQSDIAQRDARERRQEAIEQRQQNQSLLKNLDEVNARIRGLEDDLFDKDVQVRTMVKRQTDLLEKVAFYEKVIKANGLDTDPQTYAGMTPPPPDVYGHVADIRTQRGNAPPLVEVTLGSDDGLLKGHQLQVFRIDNDRPRYLGVIRLSEVTANRAVGTLVQRTPNGVIQKGDNVSTKL